MKPQPYHAAIIRLGELYNWKGFKRAVAAAIPGGMLRTTAQAMGRVWRHPDFYSVWSGGIVPAQGAELYIATAVMYQTADPRHAEAVVNAWWTRHGMTPDQEVLHGVVADALENTKENQDLHRKKAAAATKEKPFRPVKAFESQEKPAWMTKKIGVNVSTRKAILMYFSAVEPGTWMEPKTIADAVNRSKATVRQTLRRMVPKSEVIENNGAYGPVTVLYKDSRI